MPLVLPEGTIRELEVSQEIMADSSRASRSEGGRVMEKAQDDARYFGQYRGVARGHEAGADGAKGIVAADDLNPQQARIVLELALLERSDLASISAFPGAP
jgi:hypothetical protein